MTRIHSIFLLALLWTAWCFLHSLLISRGFTARMKGIWGRLYGYYRLAYTIFSIISLLPVVYLQMHLEEKIIFAWPWPWYILKYGMYAFAFLLFYGGYRVYDLQYMLGIKQIDEMRHGATNDTIEFATEGILEYVRHPWYSGAILLVWAFGAVTDVSLVSKAVLTAYIIIGTLLEEKKLKDEIGAPYLAYRKRVPMFIPGIKKSCLLLWSICLK
jgi:protein-S-isoprenylcysteine O-methyltransferase Ste14